MAQQKKKKNKQKYQWVYSGKKKKDTVDSSSKPDGTTESGSTTLAKTPIHQKFFNLQEDRQWLLKQIKRKRTELDNFIEGIRSLASEMFKQAATPMQRLQDIDSDIHQIFAEIFKRKFGKKSRQDVERIYTQLQMMGVISTNQEWFNTLDTDDEDDDWDDGFDDMPPFDDFPGGNPFADAQSATEPEPTPDRPAHQRDMRQTFLRLASIYHPDRAGDEDTQAIHTEIMKEINRAYKDGDFARLLELEKQQQSGELEQTDLEAVDDLERACQQLEQENNTLREQYEGIKTELRNLRNNTQEGDMLKTYRRAKKAGVDIFVQMAEEAQEEIEYMEMMRDFVRDFRDRKITIKDFLKGPSRGSVELTQEEMLVAMQDLLGIRIVDEDDLF
ncbi:MAG: molecular chaperone DnaJ [Spirulina sp. SIO3F2]|nr:molecular chaperone DnaJ [Spirulina sp. SIO3F2]